MKLHPKHVTEWHKTNKTNRTGFLGVKQIKGGSYVAYIREHGKKEKRYCGIAKTAEEAGRLYDKMALQLYGDEAVTNFPISRFF